MNLRMISAIVIFLILIAGGITFGQDDPVSALRHFIDTPSLFIVLGIVLSGALWSYPIAETKQAFFDAFSADEIEEGRAKQGYRIFQSMAGYAVSGGIVGTVIGLIKMLSNLDDPTAIGPAMAVALLTILYGVIFGEVVFKSMANSCLSKNPSVFSREEFRGFVTPYATLFALFTLISCFATMLLAFASFD